MGECGNSAAGKVRAHRSANFKKNAYPTVWIQLLFVILFLVALASHFLILWLVLCHIIVFVLHLLVFVFLIILLLIFITFLLNFCLLHLNYKLLSLIRMAVCV